MEKRYTVQKFIDNYDDIARRTILSCQLRSNVVITTKSISRFNNILMSLYRCELCSLEDPVVIEQGGLSKSKTTEIDELTGVFNKMKVTGKRGRGRTLPWKDVGNSIAPTKKLTIEPRPSEPAVEPIVLEANVPYGSSVNDTKDWYERIGALKIMGETIPGKLQYVGPITVYYYYCYYTTLEEVKKWNERNPMPTVIFISKVSYHHHVRMTKFDYNDVDEFLSYCNVKKPVFINIVGMTVIVGFDTRKDARLFLQVWMTYIGGTNYPQIKNDIEEYDQFLKDKGIDLETSSPHYKTIRRLLNGSYDDLENAMKYAVMHNMVDVTKFLIDAGTSNLDTILSVAASEGRKDVVRLLLDNNVDVNSRDGQALIKAASGDHSDIVDLLLANGADIHVRQDEALRQAVANSALGTVALLLRRGADKGANDNEAIKIARRNNNRILIDMLR